jgi:hypothetical protein
MVTVTGSYTPTEQNILTFCGKWIPIYEHKISQRGLATLTRRFMQALKQHFSQRETEALARLRTVWQYKMEAIERLSDTDWIAMHLFDLDEEQELLAAVFQPYYMEAGETGAERSTKYLSNMLGRELTFKGARTWIQNNAIKFGKKYAREVSATTNQAIRDQLAEAIKEGEDLNQVMDRIASVYRSAEGYRSEMIGRTEMGRAYTLSSVEQDRVYGIQSWIWDFCDPNCPICGPFMASNPHTYEEIVWFRDVGTHPSCQGDAYPEVPDDFVPNEI